MALAYFIAPYEVESGNPRARFCAMDNWTTQIRADGGTWRESEFLGNRALVKVRASAATLTTIANSPGFFRILLSSLDNPLSSLTNGQRNALRNQVTDAGYTLAEFNAAVPDIAAATLGDVLRFLLRRRLKPRFDAPSQTIILDGEIQTTVPIEEIDVVL